MCILFLYVAKSPPSINAAKPSLRLVLASNRDEFYSRPTKQATFWEKEPNILAGQDAEEGGTWLGISKTGKIAILLNIMSKAPQDKKQSRGELVTGFLRSSPGLRGATYCNNLNQDPDLDIREKFRLFNLITIDLTQPTPLCPNTVLNDEDNERRSMGKSKSEQHHPSRPLSSGHNQGFEINYFTNATDTGPRNLSETEQELFGFGNSTHDCPFKKVSTGCSLFEDIIKEYKEQHVTPTMTYGLKDKLVTFLRGEDRQYPDPQLEKQGAHANHPPSVLPNLSSIFVKSLPANYGTRTHTVIVVDSENHVDFHEWTLQEPIDIQNPCWLESNLEFDLTTEALRSNI